MPGRKARSAAKQQRESAADLAALNEMDDWASKWAELQASGGEWGGRGKGGRGVQVSAHAARTCLRP
jgi:hypothetical protein